jgi:hypothetical protein
MKLNRRQRRALINQQNAQHSTGPRTEPGKAIASQNAQSHGLAAAATVLPFEDRREYERLAQALQTELRPRNEHQRFLVEQILDAQWRLNRIKRLEWAYFDMLLELGDDAAPEHRILRKMMERKGDPLATLRRHETALERTYHRCHKELREAQKRDQAEQPSPQATPSRHLEIAREVDDFVTRELAAIDREMAHIDQFIQNQYMSKVSAPDTEPSL